MQASATMEPDDTDRASMVNRKAFSDVFYQQTCLKNVCDQLCSNSQTCQEELKAILQDAYPGYLPAPGSCPVVIRFNSQKVPHFEFHLCPMPLPLGCPEYDCDKEVAFYSAKIYSILKKDIDKERMEKKGKDGGSETQISSTENENNEEDGEANQQPLENALSHDTLTSFLEQSMVEDKVDRIQEEASNSHSPSSTLASLGLNAGTSTNLPNASDESSPVNVIVKSEPNDTSSISQPISKTVPKRKVTNMFLTRAQKRPRATPVHNPPDSWTEADQLFHLALPSDEGNNRLVCPICFNSYNINYLKQHINTVHYCKKPYFCTWKDCNYETNVKQNAYVHARKHQIPGTAFDVNQIIKYVDYID